MAESLGKRNAAARAVALAALDVSLLLVACLTLLARVAVGWGLRPLLHAAQELERRSLQQLAPLPLQQLPREVAFFGAAINDLFVRLRAAVGAQRSFLDDASHQLRTRLRCCYLNRRGHLSSRTRERCIHGCSGCMRRPSAAPTWRISC